MTLPPHPLFIAFQFLTTIPINLKTIPQDDAMGRSLLYYPLVGLVIGGLLSGFSFIAGQAVSPASAPLIAALTLAFWVLTTGGLHLDGLADSTDALMGGLGDRQKTLEIMKDPTSGPMGVVSLILLLLIKFTALWVLIATQNWQGLFIAPLIARTLMITLFLTTPYVRKGGLGELIYNHMPKQKSWIVMSGAIILVIAIAGINGLWGLLAAAGLFFILRAISMSRLGGTTGDSAGAIIELTEMSILVAMVFAMS